MGVWGSAATGAEVDEGEREAAGRERERARETERGQFGESERTRGYQVPSTNRPRCELYTS